MRVVVTGVAGFVGSHIAERLIAAGHHVVGVDDLSTVGHATWIPCDWVHRDITADDLSCLRGAELVVHAAAYADISRCWDNYEERERAWRVNALGTMRVLEAIDEKARVIMLSTASVYGEQAQRVVRPEDASPETMESVYSASKFAAEGLVHCYAHARRSTWHIVRLVNVVGARYHHGHLADFVKMASQGDRVIRAKDIGHQRKSFVHVLDVADTIEAIISRGALSGIYNVASEERWSIRQSIACMGPVRVEYAMRDRGWIGDPYELHVDARALGWLLGCRYRSIESGVRDALESLGWHEQRQLAELGT